MSGSVLGLILGFLAISGQARSVGGSCRTPSKAAGSGKAVYFITNSDNNANAVIAVPIGANGKLSGGTSTKTGGNGAVFNTGANEKAKSDGLFSQSSLSIAGNHLFAVNAGSNTVSMFAIDANDATKLTRVGKPATVPGQSPNTVAASAKNNLVCVGMTGAVAGVSCASFDAKNGIGKMDNLRPFDIKQSTPPVGPLNTVSQVFWSNDEKTLFTTVKGDPTKNITGFLSAFETNSCGRAVALGSQDIQSEINNTAVLFGSQPVPGSSDIFATDASFGGAVLAVNGKGQGSLVAKQAVDGQAATCWVTISPATKSAFVTDVGKPRLVEMSVKNAKILGQVDLSSTGANGVIDLKASGNFIYALAPLGNNTNAQVLVMDVKGGSKQAKLVQSFDASTLGAGSSAQGMAIF